jgi:hypothetical protein
MNSRSTHLAHDAWPFAAASGLCLWSSVPHTVQLAGPALQALSVHAATTLILLLQPMQPDLTAALAAGRGLVMQLCSLSTVHPAADVWDGCTMCLQIC